MLRDRKIAFFIDLDNLSLTAEHYYSILSQLKDYGDIVYGVVYGAGERKHKKIIADADANGYKVCRVLATKHRGRKNFDYRIFVDVMDILSINHNVDTVCVVAQPADMSYLYSYLRNHGKAIIALDNNPQAQNFVQDFVSISVKSKSARRKKKTAEVVPAGDEAPANNVEPQKDADVERTEDLLKQIDSLKQDAAAEPQPVEEPTKEVKEQVAEPKADAAPQAEEQAPQQDAQDESKAEAEAVNKPRTQYNAQNDGELIRQINDARTQEEDVSTEAILDQIKKLLQDVE